MGIVQVHARWEEVGGAVDAGERGGKARVHAGTTVEGFGITGRLEVWYGGQWGKLAARDTTKEWRRVANENCP
eukprot:6923202-Prorocentrum_lima.AAC.1